MDNFWIKLRKRIISPPKAQPSSAMQLSRFNKCWLSIQNCLKSPEKRSQDVSQTEIPARLKLMVDLLVDEESRLEEASGTTGVCMEYLLKYNVLNTLVNISEGDRPRGIKGETIRTMAAMINLLDDRFLVHNAVHKPTVKLLRTTCVPTEDDPQGDSYHEDLVDLMYVLCSKIHGFPDLLNIFFHDKQWLTEPQRHARRLERKQNTMELLRTISQGVIDPSVAAAVAGAEHEVATEASGDPLIAAAAQTVEPTNLAQDGAASEPKADDTIGSEDMSRSNSETPKKREYEFFLFTYLLQFIHREGKVGDFARTGLLFIMELAKDSLGEYIVDSGYPEFFVSGVGALYSQLPRKLIVRGGPSNINGLVGTLSDQAPPGEGGPQVHSRRTNIEMSSSADFQSRLDAFLKLLEFCQDVLMRCPSTEISSKLLAAIKTVFLENILYPSVLECSDTDGSSVAVISYIDLILQVLEHEALVDLVVGFLMGSDDDDTSTAVATVSSNKEGDDDDQQPRKESSNDAFAHVQNPQKTSPYFMATGRFTLKDLILSRLKSRSQPTVIATLKLLNTVITRHCKYSLKLLSIHPDDKATSFTREDWAANELKTEDIPMISHHVQELDLFFALISTINPRNTSDIFCNGYEAYLRDAEGNVETHQCFVRGKEQQALRNKQGSGSAMSALERKKLRRRSMKYGHRMDLPEGQSGEAFIEEQLQLQQQQQQAGHGCCGGARGKHPHDPVPMHRLVPNDPLLQILLGTLSHFFAHSVELNLALTGVITSLATCPYRSLEGWLLFRGTDVRTPDEDKLSVEGGDDSLSPKSDRKVTLATTAGLLSQEEAALAAPAATEDSDDEETLPFYLQRGYNKGSTFEQSSKNAAALGASTTATNQVAFKSFPPFFTMLKTLTQQVDYYRSEIDNFDEFLSDRRRTLLVATELSSVIHTSSGHAQAPYPAAQPFQQHHGLPPQPPSHHQQQHHHHQHQHQASAESYVTPMSGFESLAAGWGASSSFAADSLAAAYPTHQVLQQEQQQLLQQQQQQGAVAGTGSAAAVTSPGRTASPAGLQRIQTTFTPASSAAAATAAAAAAAGSGAVSPAVAAMRIESPRARKSSSPSSLMATPSNMSFLLPPGVGKRPFRSASGSAGSTSATASLSSLSQTMMQGHHQETLAAAAGRAVRTVSGGVTVGGMVGVMGASSMVSGQQGYSHYSQQQQQYQQDVSAMAKMMETMMIKPLFPDGFVDDSDSEADKSIDLDAELREVEDEDGEERSQGDEEQKQQQQQQEVSSSSSSSARRSRDASTGAGVPVSSSSSSKAKMVTLGQLLTNVVILEEVVKEVVAVTQVRRGLGVDKVRFL